MKTVPVIGGEASDDEGPGVKDEEVTEPEAPLIGDGSVKSKALEAQGFEQIFRSNGDQYDIVGYDSQIVNIKLATGQSVMVMEH